MYDFKHYITSNDNYVFINDQNIFRKEYPDHVKRTANCFRELYADPYNWKKILRKYKLSPKKIKQIGCFKKLNGHILDVRSKRERM